MRRRRIKLGIPQIAAIVIAATFAVLLGLLIAKTIKKTEQKKETGMLSAAIGGAEEGGQPEFVDLDEAVRDWAEKGGFKAGVMVYDLDREEIAAMYNADAKMNVASIYKLFYAYAGYRQIDAGSIDADAEYVKTKDYRAGSYSFRQCLDLMMRESYNGCADALRGNRRQTNRALAVIDELDLKNTEEVGLISTAADLTRMMRMIYLHRDLSDASAEALLDSLLNQPATLVAPGVTYDWRQGLPTGFSSSVKVYDKVGWEWDGDRWAIYADAAIVEFPELDRHFVVVVITSGIGTKIPYAMQELGRRIEEVIYTTSL